jgi:transposase-like protein
MQQNTTENTVLAIDSSGQEARDVLTEILRNGARQMLATAIENEVDEYIATYAHQLDDNGQRLVVRNGHMPPRSILTGLGQIDVTRPRVNDRRVDANGRRFRFTSSILPPYLRRSKAIDELIPWLYLKGISTGDFPDALQALLGPDAGGLSATNICRMKRIWEDEWKDWSRRDLTGKRYVYVWADGIHFNIRLGDEANKKQCILVVMGATADGKKELIGITEGYRESEQSWLELLRDLKSRGLTEDPKLAAADGALGFWAAMRKVWPTTREQRCWFHKMGNVLNNMPKSIHPKSKAMLHEIWQAATKADAEKAFKLFVTTFEAKYPKAVECLAKDRDVLLAFFDFPAEHWIHLRTTNPIESTFATVRLRHRRTKGSGSRTACLTMVFKLARATEKRWRRLNGSALLPQVIQGVRFVDGIKELAA